MGAQRWAGVVVAVTCASTLVVLPAAAAPTKAAPKGSLQVVLTGDSGGAVRSVVVTGPKSFSRTLTRTATLKRLAPGRYRVAASAAPTSLGLVSVSPSGTTVRVKRGKKASTTIRFSFSPIQQSKDTTAPATVSSLTATPAGTSVALTWTNPSDPDLAQVIVRRAKGVVAPTGPDDGTAVALASPTATSVNDGGLSEKTGYSYAVFTRDAVGNTSGPVTTTTTTSDVTPPAAPGLTVTPIVVLGTAGLQADVSLPNDADLHTVRLWRVDGAGPPDTTATPLSVFTDLIPGTFLTQQGGGLVENTTYTYGVVAVDDAGNTSSLVTGTATTPGIPPGPVTNLSYDAGPTLVFLTWTNPADADFSDAIVRYQLGSTPPATPTSGSAAGATANPLWKVSFNSNPLTTYSVSIFTRDTKGNVNPVPTTATFTTRNGTGGVR